MKRITHSLSKSEPTREEENQQPFRRPIGDEFRFKQVRVFNNDDQSKTTKSEEKKMRVPDPAKEVKRRPIGDEFRFKQIRVFDNDVKSKTSESEDKTMRVPDPAKEEVKQQPFRRPIGDEFRFKQIRIFDNDAEAKTTTTEDKTTRVPEPRKEEEKQQPLRRPIGDEFRFKQIRVFDNDTQSKTTTTEDKKENDQTGKDTEDINTKRKETGKKEQDVYAAEIRHKEDSDISTSSNDPTADVKQLYPEPETKHRENSDTCIPTRGSETKQLNAEPSKGVRPEIISTERNIENMVQECVNSMKETPWITKTGKISQGAKNFLGVLEHAHNVLEKPTNIAKILMETETLNRICELVIDIQEHFMEKKLKDREQTLRLTLGVATGVLVNFTDTSAEIAEKIVIIPRFLSSLHQILAEFCEKHIHQVDTVTEEDHTLSYILNSTLTIIHNVSLIDSNIPYLRKYNFTEALQPYLKSKDKDEHLTALAGLAAIINEEESDIINSNRKVVKHLMKVLRRALRESDRRYEGWSCKELAFVIKTLARNDGNKKLLVQLGALRLLVKLTRGNHEEQQEALAAIWTLSFDDENRKVMIEDERSHVIETLADLKKSDTEKIRKAASGALWNLRDELRNSTDKTHQEIGASMILDGKTGDGWANDRQDKQVDKAGGHIFISYQWNNQKTLIDVSSELRKNGHKVWMDVDNMAGSTLQAMANAVEEADLVLVCFSQKYKNSQNCRAEAEYTFQRQKPIIPLKMELDYKPDGWLGILVGTKLFYDFSGKYNFRDKCNKLLREISGLKSQTNMVNIKSEIPKNIDHHDHGAVVEEAPASYHANEARPITTDTLDIVSTWTPEDVRTWMSKHKLTEETCGKFTVEEIILLVEMRREAPEAFYKGLQKKFNYDLRNISLIVKALKDLNT